MVRRRRAREKIERRKEERGKRKEQKDGGEL
jgi:hypothetical protein